MRCLAGACLRDSLRRRGILTKQLHAKEPACIRDAGRRMAVFASGHLRQGRQAAPPESRAGRCKLLRDGPIVLLGVERTVFADRVTEQHVEGGPGRPAELAVAMHQGEGGGPGRPP